MPAATRPNPTLLELGRMKRGAMKPPTPTSAITGNKQLRQKQFNDNYEDIDDIVQHKLHQAKVLRNARQFGFSKWVLTLSNYSAKGGAKFLAKELVRQSSATAKDDTSLQKNMLDRVKQFCDVGMVSFDGAITDYCAELCSSEQTNNSSIEESALLARYCESLTARCRVTLAILERAVLSGHSSLLLKSLSKDAIEWATGDSTLRSELEEAARLLLVDDIVRRYCGNAAAELFRVNNPRHAMKLLDFVCRHAQYPSVLTDALNLCDAIEHLSKLDACSQLMQYAILSNDAATWVALPEELLQKDSSLALGVCEKAVQYCAELIEEVVSPSCNDKCTFRIREQKRKALVATKAANDILSLAIEHVWNHRSKTEGLLSAKLFIPSDLEESKREFGRLEELQRNYTVSLSLHDLHCPRKTLHQAIKVIESLFRGYSAKNLGSELVSARRVCSLLAGSFKSQSVDLLCFAVGDFACRSAMHADDDISVVLLHDTGVFEEKEVCASAHVALALAFALCKKASLESLEERCIDGMKQFIRASALLQRSVLQRCPLTALSAAVSLAAFFDVTISLYKGTDQGVGDQLDGFRSKLLADSKIDLELSASQAVDAIETRMFNMGIVRPVLHSHWNENDGLLLPPFETHSCCIAFGKEIMSYLLCTARKHTKRRNETKRLHSFLCERGANAIALRVLGTSASLRVSSTTGQSSSSPVGLVPLAETEDTIQRVAERSLGGSGTGMTSGLVDSQFSLALLLSLPLKQAFKVSKA
jgi:hypothetical protein